MAMTFFRPPVSAARFRVFLSVLLLYALIGSSAALVKELHYGRDGGLEIECGPDELILVESERLAYSPGGRGSAGGLGRCRADSASCSVPYSQASWYCRGKSSCTGMPVERRPLHKRTCGSEFTNCLRVEYRCVKDTSLTNVCSNTVFESIDGGHLVSPRFPDMYPPRRNCTCTIIASGSGKENTDESSSSEHLRIDVGFFLIKAHDPCQDWLSIQVDSRPPVRRCGYLSNVEQFVGEKAIVNFRSDRDEQDMGFWLHFRNTRPGQKTTLRCGKYAFQKASLTTTPSTTTSGTTSTLPTTLATTKTVNTTRFTTTAPSVKAKAKPSVQTPWTTKTTAAATNGSTPAPSDDKTPISTLTVAATAGRAKKLLSQLKPPATLLRKDSPETVTLKHIKSKDEHNRATLIRQRHRQPTKTTSDRSAHAQSKTSEGKNMSEVLRRQKPTRNDNRVDERLERAVAKSGYQVDNEEAYESYREPLPTPAGTDDVTEFLIEENRKEVNASAAAPVGHREDIQSTVADPSAESELKTDHHLGEVVVEDFNAPKESRIVKDGDQSVHLPLDISMDGSGFPEHAATWTSDLSEVASQDAEVDSGRQSHAGNDNMSRHGQTVEEASMVSLEDTTSTSSVSHENFVTTNKPEVQGRNEKLKIGSGFQSGPSTLTSSSDGESVSHQPLAELDRRTRGETIEKHDTEETTVPQTEMPVTNYSVLTEAYASSASEMNADTATDDFSRTFLETTTDSVSDKVGLVNMKDGILSMEDQHHQVQGGNTSEQGRSNVIPLVPAVEHSETTEVVAGDRGVMFSKVGLDPPSWQPGEPIHWLDEPFEALLTSNDSVIVDDEQFNETLPLSTDEARLAKPDENEGTINHRMVDTAARGRPEPKSLEGEISDSEGPELSAVLSPRELEWLLSETSETKTGGTEDNETSPQEVAYSREDAELVIPAQSTAFDGKHVDLSERSDDAIAEVSGDDVESKARIDVGSDDKYIMSSSEFTGDRSQAVPDVADVQSTNIRAKDELRADEDGDAVRNNVRDNDNVVVAIIHGLEQQRRQNLFEPEAVINEAAENQRMIGTGGTDDKVSRHFISERKNLGEPVNVRGRSLYNHVDIVPIERDLDKDVVIPLFPVDRDEITHGSSRPVDIEELNGGVVEHQISPIRTSGGEYFIDRLGHMAVGVMETGEDAIQQSEHERTLFEDNVVENSASMTSSDARSPPTSPERIHVILPSDTIAHHRRPVDHSHSRSPSGHADFRFRSPPQQPPLVGDFTTATITPVTVAVQRKAVGGGKFVPNLPEVPGVASHAAYRSTASVGGVGNGSSNIIGGQNIIWAIIVVGTIGWLVFVSMLGVTIYHKRKRRQERLFAATRTPTSSIYSDFHLPTIPGMFPGRPSTASSSPGNTAASTTTTRNPLPTVMDSAGSSLHDDGDSLGSTGIYGTLNDVISARRNQILAEDSGASSQRHQQDVNLGKGKPLAPPVPATRAASSSALVYDVLPPPLFDAKNPAVALSTVTEVSEQHTPTSTMEFDGCGGRKIGRRESNTGMADFTSRDCGAVSTGWRLHQALASITNARQASSAGRDGDGGSLVMGDERKLKKKDSKISKKKKKNENEHQVPPCPPHPPPPLPRSCSSTVSVTTGCNVGKGLQPREANTSAAKQQQQQKTGNGNRRGTQGDASSAH